MAPSCRSSVLGHLCFAKSRKDKASKKSAYENTPDWIPKPHSKPQPTGEETGVSKR